MRGFRANEVKTALLSCYFEQGLIQKAGIFHGTFLPVYGALTLSFPGPSGGVSAQSFLSFPPFLPSPMKDDDFSALQEILNLFSYFFFLERHLSSGSKLAE